MLGGESSVSSSALYSSLTAGLLFLSGPSHWAPRCLPALAGALAVFLPRIPLPVRGRVEAFLAALLITLSPSLLIVSTKAEGTILGLLTAVFFLFYLQSEQPRPLVSGAALGLVAASGPAGWSGIAIAAVVLAVDALNQWGRKPAAKSECCDRIRKSFGRFLHSPAGAGGFLLALAAGCTGMFFFPRGVGALAAGFSGWFAAFFSGWPRIGELILLIAGYEPAALVFGAVGIILVGRGLLSVQDRFWTRFAVVAMVWVLIRPAACPQEILWVILPLLILGSGGLRAALESALQDGRYLSTVLFSLAVIAVAVFTVLNMASFEASENFWYLIFPWLLVIAMLLAYIISTSNWRRNGLRLLTGSAPALLAVFCCAQIGAGWNAVRIRGGAANELWRMDAFPVDLGRLRSTIEQISLWETGVKDEMTIVIQWPEESAIGWELLTYGAAEYVDQVDMFSAPPMLITPYMESEEGLITPQLAAVYRGQVFSNFEQRAWSGWPPDLFGWLLYREGPVDRGRVILWVRSDILVPEEGAAL
jgi:hypothetical protein